MSTERDLPLNRVTLAFGALSIPLAFLAQLCVPALIMAALAIVFHRWGRWRVSRGKVYSPKSLDRSRKGNRLAMVGGVFSAVMWGLWAGNVLLQ